MQLLYLLESIRMPGLDAFMLTVTRLGEETAFLVAALIIFWCVDKDKGYFVMTAGFLGTMLNQFLKLTFRVPRPWVLDPEFTILEQAREAATGFSFPSGHTTSAVATFGAIGVTAENRWVKRICLVICILVPFSRMYLGVHTPWDILAGAATSVVLIALLKPMAYGLQDTAMKGIFGFAMIFSLCMLMYARFFPFSIAETELHNLESGVKNGYTMVGCTVGVLIAWPLEKKYVKFETKAVWWAQILKVILGLAVVLLVKEGLRSPLEALFAGHMAARAVRYALIVITAGVVWPMTFRWFAKLGVKHELR